MVFFLMLFNKYVPSAQAFSACQECKLPRAAWLLLRRAWCNDCRMPSAWPAAAAMHHSASPQALPTVLPQYRCVPPMVYGRMGADCAAGSSTCQRVSASFAMVTATSCVILSQQHALDAALCSPRYWHEVWHGCITWLAIHLSDMISFLQKCTGRPDQDSTHRGPSTALERHRPVPGSLCASHRAVLSSVRACTAAHAVVRYLPFLLSSTQVTHVSLLPAWRYLQCLKYHNIVWSTYPLNYQGYALKIEHASCRCFSSTANSRSSSAGSDSLCSVAHGAHPGACARQRRPRRRFLHPAAHLHCARHPRSGRGEPLLLWLTWEFPV